MRLRNTLILLCALALLATSPAAFAGGSEVMRTLDLNLSAAGVETLSLEVPVGETHVEGTSGDQVTLVVEVRCERPVKTRCEEAARAIELSTGSRGNRLSVEVDGWPKSKSSGLTVNVDVKMPQGLKLDAEQGVGELETLGLVSDVRLELGVGEVRIRGREENVRRVDLEVGVGEAVLRLSDREIEGKGFIGRELDWRHGRGAAAVEVDCGVGEVDVRLDEE
jgi:hypothetical protein